MKRALSLLLALLMVISILPLPTVSAEGDPVFVLPTGLQEVEEQAFAGNTSISKLVIPSGVKSIGREAFADCTGLTEVSIAGTEVSIDKDAFLNCSKDVVFYAHEGSSAMLWAMSHGFRCDSLDEESDSLGRFLELISYSGFAPSLLMSSTFASKCLIVRTPDSMVCLPDISTYNPIDIFRSDDHLFYIQFDTEEETEACFNFLHDNSGISVEPDRIGAADDVSGQGVTIAENWGTDDTMGFDNYAPFVAQHSSGSVTIAVIDSGVKESSWGGPLSGFAASFVDASALIDSIRHGSKVASIINDCLGSNRANVTLLPIKVVNSSSMYRTSVIIESIKYAANHGADIINLSLGWDISEGTSPEIERQISAANEKGILVVAAAGNGSGNVMYPASCDGVLAVSALTYSEESGYSVRSRTGSAIDYTAPGMYLATSAYNPVDHAGDIIGTASTSFAAPQITAALALIKLDSTQSGNAVAVLDSCCMDLSAEGLPSSAYGRGLPQLGDLIPPAPIIPKNTDGGPIPSRLWLGDKGNDFILSWEVNSSNPDETNVTVVSSKPSVASVRQYGNSFALITAKGKGETVISLSNSRVTTEFTLVVQQPVTEILLTGTDGTLFVGREVDLAAAVLPEDANNRGVTWKSSKESVASVTQTGHIKALTTGKTTITCEATDGYGTKAQIEISVIEVPDAETISLTANEKEITDNKVSLEVGETLTLAATILPEEALQECRYSVAPKGIVSVSDDGIVTALETGAGKTATLVVTATTGNNVYTWLTVSVIVSPIEVRIIADKTTLDIGETEALVAEVLPDNATDKSVSWTSKNPAVATVNGKTGLVEAVAPGSAEIVCTTANGKTDSITVTVRQPITITFDPNGGVCEESTRIAYSGYEIGSLPTPTREYYTFSGWYTAGGTKVSATSVFTADTTLYAHWTGKQYTISFDPNGGNCDTATMTARVGEKVGTLPTPTRSYYSFTGWFTAASGGAEITADYIQNHDSNLSVYAHWLAHTYTVTFDPNGGTPTPEPKNVSVDSPIGVLPEPERAYYVLNGWYTERTGGIKITKDYSQSVPDPLPLYAQWTPLPYTMTFDANGGSVDPKTKECFVDTEVGELPVPTRAYYDFEGWYTEDGKTHVTKTYQQETNKDITVYAKWTPHTYTVSFDPNSGNCDTSSIIGTVDKPIGTLPTPTKDYYRWDGWYKENGTKIDSTYVQHEDDNITVYAHWTPNPYTMTFDANGGSVSPTQKTCYVDTKVGDLPVPTRNYYTFKGWFTAKSGGTEITKDDAQRTDSAITVYAQWTPGEYTITLNPNGGNGDTTTIKAKVDTPVDLPDRTRNYYNFKGWYTASTDGSIVSDPYTQSNTTNRTFYAYWSPMQYTMKFDANGGTTPVSTKQYYVDTKVSDLPTPTRNYYTFNGWYTEKTGGTKVDSNFAHPNTDTITVYAQWSPKPFTLTLDPKNGSSTTARTCYVDTKIGDLPTPTRDYYKFLGWFTAESGGNKVTPETKFSNDSNRTIYGQWELKPESNWVTQDKVPSGAKITQTSYSYRESTESTDSSKSGWTGNGDYWKKTGSGSKQYASFPSTFDTNNSVYKSLDKSPYTGSNNGTTKREVSNPTWAGYVYWHWAYNAAYYNTTARWISDREQEAGSSRGLPDYYYCYFYAFKSTTDAPTIDGFTYTWGANAKYDSGVTTYNCHNCLPGDADKSNPKSGVNNPRFLRFDYYTSSYTDSQKMYKYYRDLSYQSTDPGSGSNGVTISNKVTYVKYREK